MFRFDEGLKVYLHREPVDFRLGDTFAGGFAASGAGPGRQTRSRLALAMLTFNPASRAGLNGRYVKYS